MSAINHREWDYYGKRQGWNTPTGRLGDDALLAEAERRGYHLVSPETDPPQLTPSGLESDVAKFIDPNNEISARDQLELMAEVVTRFGEVPLRLNAKRLKAVEAMIEKYPSWRLVSSVLRPNVSHRADIVNPRTSLTKQLMGPYKRLWTPQETPADDQADQWGDLWAGKKDIIYRRDRVLTLPLGRSREYPEPKLSPYRLLHKAAGKMVNRRRYFEYLAANGQGQIELDGSVKTLALMDVSYTLPDSQYKDPLELYARLDPSISPEVRLRVQSLHVLAGRPLHPDVTHIANEAVCELRGANRHFKGIAALVGITRSQDQKFLRMGMWSTRSLPDWQPSPGISALQSD